MGSSINPIAYCLGDLAQAIATLHSVLTTTADCGCAPA
jgi:hypothetical protein